MKILPEDNRFIKEVIENQEYKYLYDYPVVVDLGANIGTFSMWIYDKAEKIYAVEPVPAIFNYLQQNVINNQLDKIKTFNFAIGSSSGKRMMKLDPQVTGGGSKVITEMIGGDIEVDCKQLVDFMSEEGIKYIDLLKMDVEGSEEEILHNNFPADRIGTIIGECHWGHNVEGKLKELGYRYTNQGSHFIARK